MQTGYTAGQRPSPAGRIRELERGNAAATAAVTGVVRGVPSATTVLVRSLGVERELRRLGAYSAPAVGDTVIVVPTDAGWIVMGKLA